MNENRCVTCGAIIPEGRQVCPVCMARHDHGITVDPASDDFGTILICAIRYSLGRQTYMPSLVTSYIRSVLPAVEFKCLKIMERDIETHGCVTNDKAAYGMKCDYAEWMRFLADVQAEIRRRIEK